MPKLHIREMSFEVWDVRYRYQDCAPAVRVLEYFDEIQQPISLKDIAAHFEYPVSSASALLKSMVVMGYRYDGYSRTYMPTMRIATLGNWVQGALFGEAASSRADEAHERCVA